MVFGNSQYISFDIKTECLKFACVKEFSIFMWYKFIQNIHKLKKYFGFSQFKGQRASDSKFVSRTFVIMPTGGGKSLCYQLPALTKRDGNCCFSSYCFNEKPGRCY
jgi:superfamily II DNA helicase RecQ